MKTSFRSLELCAQGTVARGEEEFRDDNLTVRMHLVSRSKLMEGGGKLGVMLRWLGRLGDRRARRANPRSNSNIESLPLRLELQWPVTIVPDGQ